MGARQSPLDNFPLDHCFPNNCPPYMLPPSTIAPRTIPPRTIPTQDTCPPYNYSWTIPIWENCPQIIAPRQFPPRKIDPLDISHLGVAQTRMTHAFVSDKSQLIPTLSKSMRRAKFLLLPIFFESFFQFYFQANMAIKLFFKINEQKMTTS